MKDAHAALDAAVLAAYGFSTKTDLLAQLLDLNHTVANRIENGDPVTAPGIPPNYPNPKRSSRPTASARETAIREKPALFEVVFRGSAPKGQQ